MEISLTGECPPRCHPSTVLFPPPQCLLPKQIFPYITTPLSTRLIEFAVRPHLTLPLPSTSQEPLDQLNPTPPDVLPDRSVPMTTPPTSPPPNPVPPTLPELPATDLSAADFSLSLESIFGLPPSS
jgi:hypothetical protein